MLDSDQGRLPPGTPTLAAEHLGYEAVGLLLFRGDGSMLFYTACTKGSWQGIFRQDITTQSYEGIAPLVLSRDGMTVAYAVEQQAHWRLGKYAPLSALQHAPDGTLIKNQPYALSEYPPGKAYDELGTPVISPGSTRIAVAARTGTSWQMVESACVGREEKAGAAYEAIGTPLFSADGQHLLYTAKRQGQWLLLRDGRPIGVPADELRTPVFSLDGAHTLVAARQETAWSIILDGVAGRVQQTVGDPVFSPDGAHFAYVTSRAGVSWVVVDGVNGPPYPGIVYDAVFADGPAAFHYYGYRKADNVPLQNPSYQLLRVTVSAR